MRIIKFSFTNHTTGWHVKDVNLDALSLLVGASGVGKTQILRAILQMQQIACGKSINGREWNVDFGEGHDRFNWSGRFELVPDFGEILKLDVAYFAIVEEKLVRNENDLIFSRNDKELLYHGKPTVKLDPSKSAVELLKEEADVAPVNKAFKKILRLDTNDDIVFRIRTGVYKSAKSDLSLKEIKNLAAPSQLDRLFIIQKSNPSLFNQIKDSFIDIFPLVEDIDFDMEAIFKDDYVPVLKIKEKDVDAWIKFPDISAGMCRALSQIVTLALSDDGDVIMIDEFENGLGINCIDLLADMAKDNDSDVQIILTSHHPYIINSIPFQDWRIVSRKGSKVIVNTAADFNIGSHSKHDAFMQLIQTDAYRTGQA